MLRNLLIYRFLIINLLALLGGFIAWDRGWIQSIYLNDFTYITWAITGLFVVTWLTTLRRVFGIGNTLNMIKIKRLWIINKSQEDKAWAKVKWLRDASGWLVGLGLLGTIIGFSHSLTGVDSGSLATSEGVSGAIGPLMEGMRVALNTTIAGSIFSMWNDVNQRMLRTAMTCAIADSESA